MDTRRVEGEMSLDYKEIYETLNDEQRYALGKVIDRALAMKASNEAHITTASMLALYSVTGSCLNLNQEQFTLFWNVVHYIILNKKHIKKVIHEAMRREFFDSMDQLIVEQKKG